MNGWRNGLLGRWMDGWIIGRMGWIIGRKDGWMVGWMDCQTSQTCVSVSVCAADAALGPDLSVLTIIIHHPP